MKKLKKKIRKIEKKLIQLNKINKNTPLSVGGFMLKNNNIKKKFFTKLRYITKYLKYIILKY